MMFARLLLIALLVSVVFAEKVAPIERTVDDVAKEILESHVGAKLEVRDTVFPTSPTKSVSYVQQLYKSTEPSEDDEAKLGQKATDTINQLRGAIETVGAAIALVLFSFFPSVPTIGLIVKNTAKATIQAELTIIDTLLKTTTVALNEFYKAYKTVLTSTSFTPLHKTYNIHSTAQHSATQHRTPTYTPHYH